MSDTRKQWIPQSGEGSQNQSTAGYRILIDSMKKILDKQDDYDNNDDE